MQAVLHLYAGVDPDRSGNWVVLALDPHRVHLRSGYATLEEVLLAMVWQGIDQSLRSRHDLPASRFAQILTGLHETARRSHAHASAPGALCAFLPAPTYSASDFAREALRLTLKRGGIGFETVDRSFTVLRRSLLHLEPIDSDDTERRLQQTVRFGHPLSYDLLLGVVLAAIRHRLSFGPDLVERVQHAAAVLGSAAPDGERAARRILGSSLYSTSHLLAASGAVLFGRLDADSAFWRPGPLYPEDNEARELAEACLPLARTLAAFDAAAIAHAAGLRVDPMELSSFARDEVLRPTTGHETLAAEEAVAAILEAGRPLLGRTKAARDALLVRLADRHVNIISRLGA